MLSARLRAVLLETEDREIIALRCAACKHNVFPIYAYDGGDLVARTLDRLFGASTVLVGPAPCVPKLFREKPEDSLLHHGLNRRRGVAVEVDGSDLPRCGV